MNKLDKLYTDLLQDILDNGVSKSDRTGTGTISVFGRQIRHNMKDGFPLLTTKKMPFKTITTELLWFLRGDTNIKFLLDNDCHIWNGDAWKNYLKKTKKYIGCCPECVEGYENEEEWEFDDKCICGTEKVSNILSQEEFINKIKTNRMFAFEWGELGPIYGAQWRRWFPGGIDQIANLIHDLKTNPDSRRLMVNAWNVGELDSMVLPPCHYGFQVYTRELSVVERMEYYGKHFMKETESKTFDELCQIDYDKLNIPTRAISLMWNQRSVDTFLGLPFNIASYGLLLEIIAKAVNMVPDELIGNLGDTHLYLNHIEQAKEQIGRKFTEEEIHEHLQQSGMDALMIDARARYIDSLPNKTREPYPLPSLKHLKTDDFYKSLSEDVSLFTHLDINDFMVEGYQSHPHIKAPLSN
jgi:thymidylate synthase